MQNQLDNPGSQIYKDIVLFATERADLKIGKFEGVQWYMKAAGANSMGGIQGMTQSTLQGVEKNKDYFKEIMKIKDEDAWLDFIGDLEDAMTRSGDEFFKIVD